MVTPMSREALIEAVKKAGTQTALAEAIGKRQAHVHYWLTKAVGEVPPAEFVLKIEAATGVSRHRLRPDLYGPSPASV